MKSYRLCFFLLVSLVSGFICPKTWGQENFSTFSEYLSPEKLYLQTDREVYCVGDTIWFKGYLQNASQVSKYAACNYIYVELISSMVEMNYDMGREENVNSLGKRVKIKREMGTFSGHVVIPSNLNTGIAILRGYSFWMLNKEADYMFSKNIELRNPIKDDYAFQLKEEKVLESSTYTEIGLSNPFSRKSNDSTEKIDLQLLPESGRYLYDVESVFGVKVVGEDGLGKEVSGTVWADNEAVGSFGTDDVGKGKVSVTIPSGTSKVYATVDSSDKKYSIPLPENNAAVINCSVDSENVKIALTCRGITPKGKLSLVAYDRSEIYFVQEYDPSIKVMTFSYKDLYPGINNVALVDEEGNVYAERAFFVCPDDTKVSAALSTDKVSYRKREDVKCEFILKDNNGNPLKGDFAVSVSDNSFAPYSGLGYNIISYMYLGSELQTFVEDSWRYFNPERSLDERLQDVDLVMLTQGWKYYDLPKILTGTVPLPLCGKEYAQSINGKVIAPLGKTAKKANLSFIAQSIRFSTIHQLDSSGFFNLNNLNFPEGTKFLVSAEGLGGSKLFTPVMNGDVFAKIVNYPYYLKDVKYDSQYKVASMPEYYDEDGSLTLLLKESYISDSRNVGRKNLSPFPEYQFKPGQYKTKEELAPYATYDIPSFVVNSYPSLRIGVSDSDSTGTSIGTTTILCKTDKVSSRMNISSGWEPIIIFINRMEASFDELAMLNIGDLDGLAFLSGNSATPFNSLHDSGSTPRSVLLVSTPLNTRSPSNVSSLIPLGWQRPSKFYEQRYETPASLRSYERMRATLYWNPDLEFGSDGSSKFDFYTSDHMSDYTVIIEGITETGEPVFYKNTISRQ
ncbi:MAG: hypothetical protein MJZ16_08175 [Bacteroidales bacterium]|nr:hypothetical protein [Bacteroidales bacterium]